MLQTIKDILQDWHGRYGEREKLQHAYLAVGMIGIIVAGLFSLVDASWGRTVSRVSFLAVCIAVINMLFWALVYGLVLVKLNPRNTRRK